MNFEELMNLYNRFELGEQGLHIGEEDRMLWMIFVLHRRLDIMEERGDSMPSWDTALLVREFHVFRETLLGSLE